MISVVIPTLGRPGLLAEALASVEAQTLRDLEVIVVNDGGHALGHVVAPWRRRLRLRLIELPERRGAAAARNVAIDHAEGSYIAFLDDDDLFLPHHLEIACRALATTGLDFVYLGAVVSDRRLRSLPPDWRRMHRKMYEFDRRFLQVANYIHTGSIVVRNFRDTAARFDESLSHCEDWDMWIALTTTLAYDAICVGEVTTIYHQIAGVDGLVAAAQRVTPSPFSIVRERMYAKWPVDDDTLVVVAYRRWFTRFEDHRNQRIAAGLPIPTQLFDRVLRRLYGWFRQEREPDSAAIADLFVEP